MVTVQTRSRHGLCGLFGRPGAVEGCNEASAAAATHGTKVDQSKAKARKGERGDVKAISTHVEQILEKG